MRHAGPEAFQVGLFIGQCGPGLSFSIEGVASQSMPKKNPVKKAKDEQMLYKVSHVFTYIYLFYLAIAPKAASMIYGLLIAVPLAARLGLYCTGQSADCINFKQAICEKQKIYET